MIVLVGCFEIEIIQLIMLYLLEMTILLLKQCVRNGQDKEEMLILLCCSLDLFMGFLFCFC
jgi:hypothetical protein